VAAAIGVILAAVYLLWAFQKVFHGVPDEPNEKIRDLDWKEILVMAPLCVLVLVIGLYPKPFLTRMEPSVDHLISHVEQNSNYKQPAVTQTGHVAESPPGQGGDHAAAAPTGSEEAGK
jgi:NADH-quinone oxidoreductase subunit M